MHFDISGFARDVKAIVSGIPSGKVLSYSDVAALAGFPAHARQVGKVLGAIGMDSDVPCHRVVTCTGRTAPHWHSQRQLLAAEGVCFRPNGNVDMKKCRWAFDFEN